LFAFGEEIPEEFAEADDDGTRGWSGCVHIVKVKEKFWANGFVEARRTPRPARSGCATEKRTQSNSPRPTTMGRGVGEGEDMCQKETKVRRKEPTSREARDKFRSATTTERKSGGIPGKDRDAKTRNPLLHEE
jgi:hypothetical protein